MTERNANESDIDSGDDLTGGYGGDPTTDRDDPAASDTGKGNGDEGSAASTEADNLGSSSPDGGLTSGGLGTSTSADMAHSYVEQS